MEAEYIALCGDDAIDQDQMSVRALSMEHGAKAMDEGNALVCESAGASELFAMMAWMILSSILMTRLNSLASWLR